MAAKQYSVPFVVLTGLYKLCPQYPYPADMDMYSSFRSPAGKRGEGWGGPKGRGFYDVLTFFFSFLILFL